MNYQKTGEFCNFQKQTENMPLKREALSAICAENKKLDMDDMFLDSKNECKS